MNKNTRVFEELTIPSSRESDEGGLSRRVEFCPAEREAERREGHFTGKDLQEPKSGVGRAWGLMRQGDCVEESEARQGEGRAGEGHRHMTWARPGSSPTWTTRPVFMCLFRWAPWPAVFTLTAKSREHTCHSREKRRGVVCGRRRGRQGAPGGESGLESVFKPLWALIFSFGK